MANDNQSRNPPRNTNRNAPRTGKTRPWNVLFPRNYQDADGQDRTEFLRVGVAWPLKDKPGYRLEILGVSYVIMPQTDREPDDGG